eukprot:TRINITY_DN2130_c1_g1_i4.p1 TRINITY_DN2130_c1_g1~~TRINITY_DN2130_c1_g1_i4.p1  ORF type:complete len:127 (+),score=36.74 TRINITY_DN2130_c1_g1_i4:130-510(+)
MNRVNPTSSLPTNSLAVLRQLLREGYHVPRFNNRKIGSKWWSTTVIELFRQNKHLNDTEEINKHQQLAIHYTLHLRKSREQMGLFSQFKVVDLRSSIKKMSELVGLGVPEFPEEREKMIEEREKSN